MKHLLLISGLLLSYVGLWAQTCVSSDSLATEALQADVYFLANDFLEGREAGTPGEELAAEYLVSRFTRLGLQPFFPGESYRQPFALYRPVTMGSAPRLDVPNRDLLPGQDFYPLTYSSNADLRDLALVDVGFGIVAPELEYSDYPDPDQVAGKVFLMNFSSPDGVHPHSKYLKYHDLKDRLTLAKNQGAAAVLVYNPEDYLDNPAREFQRIDEVGLPVMFVQEKWVDYLREQGRIERLSVNLQENPSTAHNVAAWLDRGAEQSIVIGAHYDHLGYGDEGSRYRGAEKRVHNGADDNASGTAGLLILAEYFAQHPEYDRYNLIFLAFSGEEKGLLGSKHFVQASPVALSQINCMLNMDMIGRLDEDRALVVNGVGTSPAWQELLTVSNCYDFTLKTTESGVGPSDHTSFYLQDIPVLHFFSGTHRDYHHPNDDAHLVNYSGTADILAYLSSLIIRLNEADPLIFTETKQEDNANRPRFKVTLGVMPDYTFEGDGMRIDAVTEGKPAAEAGIQGGDVITRMGDLKIRGMQTYMQGLGQFEPGQETTVTVLRAGKEMEVKVRF